VNQVQMGTSLRVEVALEARFFSRLVEAFESTGNYPWLEVTEDEGCLWHLWIEGIAHLVATEELDRVGESPYTVKVLWWARSHL
jgi:hypothetical protein